MQVPGGSVKLYALAGAALVTIAALTVAGVALVEGHGLDDPTIVQLFGFAFTIDVALLGIAGLGGAVQNVHLAVNSRLDQMLLTTASDAKQQGVTEATAAIAAANPATTIPPPSAPSPGAP